MPSSIANDLVLLSQPALSKVHPILKGRVEELIVVLADEAHLYFAAHMGLRSYEVQAALYAQGRLLYLEVNQLRQKAGLPRILPAEAAKKVTNAPAGKSWHNYGLAVDIVEDGDPNKAGIQWSWANTKSYLKIGQYATRVGLSWGGFWKAFKDYPHVELIGDLSLAKAKEMYSPNIAGIGQKVIDSYISNYYA
jgi:peptidoglycan L-alanyl-D-glutamate endopeptidase CwlK